jgi:hypothetical protein
VLEHERLLWSGVPRPVGGRGNIIGYFDSFFPGSLQVMSDIPLYRGPMCDNTYKLLVAVDTPVRNVLVVGNCDM